MAAFFKLMQVIIYRVSCSEKYWRENFVTLIRHNQFTGTIPTKGIGY
jgi:hypothetical protein